MRLNRVAGLAAVIGLLFGTALVSVARAQSVPTGRELALSLPESCPGKAELSLARDERGAVQGRWVSVPGPVFPEEGFGARPAIRAHSIDPRDPRRQLATDGFRIQRTVDGGCTWSQVHEVGNVVSVNLSGELVIEERIRQIEQVTLADGQQRAWALLGPEQDGAGAVRMIVSDDGGATWQERSTGLPPSHTRFDSSFIDCGDGPCPAVRMAAAPSDPDVAYVVVNRQTSADFFRTTDGGRTWTSLVNAQNFSTQGYYGFAVSPTDSETVWVVSQSLLMVSRDGGTTWDFPLPSGVRVIHLHLNDDGRTIQVFQPGFNGEAGRYPSFLRSVDGGLTWHDTELAEALNGFPAIAQGGDPDNMILSTDAPDSVRIYDPAAAQFRPVATASIGDVNAPRLDRTREPVAWFRGFADIAVFVPGPIPQAEIPPLPPRPVFPPLPGETLAAQRVPGELNPPNLDTDLGPEGSQVVDYRLELPAQPTPVDIYFLMDTSGSMAGAHEGLRAGIERIIDELAASKFDAWYGLGEFPSRSIFYDRVAALAPPGDELYEALATLDTDGQTNEIHPTALYQSVTGAGQEDAGIPAGRDAGFRANALKIIVHATDEPYGDDRAGPSREDAAETLRVAGVRHVGLDLSDGATVPEAGDVLSVSKRDHDYMATETGTFAPPEGVDCNGDGRLELEAGEPLTCPIDRRFDQTAIAPAIISAVRAVRDETLVDLVVLEAGGLKVEPQVPSHSPVNLKVANSLAFPVKFTCPPEMTGRVAEVKLRSRVRGAPSGEALARIGCGAPVPVNRPASPRPLAAAVPIVLAPPQVVPNIEPAVSPLQQPAPSQVAAPSAQPGVAAQPGEVQTAKQRAGNPSPPPPESGRGSEPSPATSGTLAAGAALAAGTGAWATRRERGQVKARQRT